MTAVDMVPYAAAAGGALAFMAWLLPWGRQPTPRPRGLEDIVDEAPVQLRPAVLSFASNAHAQQMFADLKLGSAELGFPKVESWEYTRQGITVDVLMRGGHTLSTWSDRETRAAIAHYIGVPDVAVSSPAPGVVRLDVRLYDTLAESAPVPVVIGDGVDLTAVPTGVFEDGTTWRVPVQGRHVLLGGETGSGKSGVLWSLVNGMGPAIAAGRVELRVIDPKGGMELGWLEPLCTRFECTMPETMIGLLEESVSDMQERAQRWRGKVRKPEPTRENPLVVIIIDEAATLSAFTDSKLRARFEQAHGLLLSQGRAPLFSVIETVIDPSKETVPQRQLLPYRIGLRMAEPTQVEMIHGRGARDRGSYCDEIDYATPGVCYVQEDGIAGFRRARAYQVTDDDIDWIVNRYKPQQAAIDYAPQADYSGFDPDDLGDETPGDGLAAA
ncbi:MULTISPECIES: FtsK/SpoIIIE domain-containing protein [Nocardia]|uniref:FtsK domain-containing protein n=1 Tax=Nocardia nova TaxID=37330 RepID=A0A2T2Z1C6_9NOCA|nr:MULTISPECIES: FtsK/SpoIIIE domain-containing protein [Nocardia]PSR61568.1 hypothetical protein C8259_18635 [Nocardia nova]